MKSYKSSCNKENFKYAEKNKFGKNIIRWDVSEHTEGEGKDSYVVCTYKEIIMEGSLTLENVVPVLVRDKYKDTDEFKYSRWFRKQNLTPEQQMEIDEFDNYVEWCYEEARKICE